MESTQEAGFPSSSGYKINPAGKDKESETVSEGIGDYTPYEKDMLKFEEIAENDSREDSREKVDNESTETQGRLKKVLLSQNLCSFKWKNRFGMKIEDKAEYQLRHNFTSYVLFCITSLLFFHPLIFTVYYTDGSESLPKSLSDEELLLLLENDNCDLNILNDEDDDPGGWDNDSGDEVPNENAESVPIAPINPKVNAQVKKQALNSAEHRRSLEEMEVAISDAPPAAPTSESGWSILRNWNIQNFDRNLVIKQLHVKYGVSPYFRVSVQPNPRLPGSYSITISPSGLGLPDKYYYYTPQNDPVCDSLKVLHENERILQVQIAYKQMIRDVVILFSQYTKSDAQKFGEDMFSYEKRIAEITPSLHESINFVNTYNPVKISELKLTVSSLPLQDILTAMFPEFNVTEETEVIVTSLYYLTEVARVATSTDSKTLSDYIIWTLVREYLPYLSTEYTSTLSLFRGEIFGFRQAHPRWEKCTSLVQNVMGFAIGSALEYNHPIKATTEMLVETIFEETRSAVHEKLSKMEISSSFNKFLSNKLAKLQLQVGFPNNAATYQKYLKEYYSKLMILKGSLFESIKHSLFFKRRVEERLLKSPQVNDQLLSRLVEEPDKVGYVPSLNTVVVPRMLLTEPLFDEKFPSSILYGRLGVSMAEAVISSILPYDNMWTADLKLLSPFHLTVNESYAIIVNAKYCLENFLEHATIASKSDPELVTLSTLKHLFAVNIAHEALRNFKKDTKHVHHPSLEKLEDSALFFLTYSQMQCSVSATQQDIYDNVVNYKLSQKSLLEASWTHLPEFPTSLECKNVNKIQCNNIF
ncbi:hypothetical protein FQA39_LY16420 [Lamprigera yunnana]|nr:hypothetical protein FQA39_LY16420 [Lamprigera yunnana]